MTGEKFAEWMDTNQVSVEEAASLFGSSEQTIYNWRSTAGVPQKKDEWAKRIMEGYLSNRKNELPDRLTLEPTRDEFDTWNRAALLSGKIVRDWAIDSLNELAENESGLYASRQSSIPLVREDSEDRDPSSGEVSGSGNPDPFQKDIDSQDKKSGVA